MELELTLDDYKLFVSIEEPGEERTKVEVFKKKDRSHCGNIIIIIMVGSSTFCYENDYLSVKKCPRNIF